MASSWSAVRACPLISSLSAVTCAVLMALISFSPRRRTPAASRLNRAELDGVDAELAVGAGVDAELAVGAGVVGAGSFRFCNFAKLNGIGLEEMSGQ